MFPTTARRVEGKKWRAKDGGGVGGGSWVQGGGSRLEGRYSSIDINR